MTQSAAKLTENPFFILGANYRSSVADLSDLVEDAEFDGAYDSDRLHQAQQALVTPRTRLMAELSWLPELSSAQVRKVLALLETDEQSELLIAIDHFPELARANIAADVCASNDASQEVLHFLVAAWDDVDVQHLLSFINETREASGFPKVDEKQVKKALDDLQRGHAAIAAESIWRFSAPGQLMNDVVEAELARDPSTAFLRQLVSEYDSRSEQDLAHIEADIHYHLEEAQKVDQTLKSHVDALCRLLDAWDDVNQPVQLYEQHRGHEEGRSKRVYMSIRSICIDLANDHGKYEDALRLSEALLHTFPELESVAEALKKDVDTLQSLTEEQAREQNIQPLISACERAKKNLKLGSSLVRHGFSVKAPGVLGEIVRAFNDATQKLDEPSIAFFIVRDLALNINNNENDPETAFRLIDALITKAGRGGPKAVISQLKDDRAVLHKNWKMEELNRQTGNHSAMLQTINELLKDATGSDRAEFMRLKSKIQWARTRKKIKLGVFTAMAAAGVYFIYMEEQNSPSRPTYQSTSSSSSSSKSSSSQSSSSVTASNNYDEELPPAGQDRLLSRSQLRYCIFQGERLDYMRPLTQSNYEINKFNELVRDYNARCSSFRYTPGALAAVEREASSRASILRAEAKRVFSSW